MSQNIHTSPELHTVAEKLAPYLEAGTDYYFINANTEFGVAYKKLFAVRNGIKQYDTHSETEAVTGLNAITKALPQNTVVEYTLRKGEPASAQIYSPEMLLKAMCLELRTEMAAGFSKVESQADFVDGRLKEISEAWTATGGNTEQRQWTYLVDFLNGFVSATNCGISAMSIRMENDDFTVQSAPAVPGLTAEYVSEPENLELDSNDLAAIYAFLESFSEARRALAMQALKDNPAFYQQAEQRYLNFIRTRLNDPGAGLERFDEAALTKAESRWFLGRHFAKDTISFSYFNDDQSRLVVDFIGSIVKNAVDIEAYIAQATALDNEEALVKLYDSVAKDARKKIVKEASASGEGWFGEIARHLINLKLKKVLLNKTEMEFADRSPVMKEFMFFLNLSSKKSIYIDIFQSEAPRLTEMFWMLRQVPDTSWVDVSPKIPESPLKFSRAGRYDLGDGYGWETFSRPRD